MKSVIAGLVCEPYGLARRNRFGGTSERGGACLGESFAAVTPRRSRNGLKFSVVERVFGFLLPGSKTDPRSPLLRFPDKLIDSWPTCSVVVVIVRGDTFLCLSRRRVCIVIFDASAGGNRAVALFRLFPPKAIANKQSLPPTDPRKVMLDEQDDRVQSRLARVAKRKSHQAVNVVIVIVVEPLLSFLLLSLL